MGDRTSVTITVRKKDYEPLLAKEGESQDAFRAAIGADSIDDGGEWVVFHGYEVN